MELPAEASAMKTASASLLFVCRNRRIEQYLCTIGIRPIRSEKGPDCMTAWIFRLTPRILEAVHFSDRISERKRIDIHGCEV